METLVTTNNLVNLGMNLSVVGIAWFFARKYMDRLEKRGSDNAEGVEEAKKKAAEDLAKTTKESAIALEKFNNAMTKELKDAIHENRLEYKEQSIEILRRLDDVNAHMLIANGRTTKNELAIVKVEGCIKTQIALCKERNGGRRSTDRCGGDVDEK